MTEKTYTQKEVDEMLIEQKEHYSKKFDDYVEAINSLNAELKKSPHLKNRADMVNGHYCIRRYRDDGTAEFWNVNLKRWCSTATVFELNT